MEQSQTIPTLNETTVLPKQLKIICILSLIMGGIMIISSLWNIKVHYAPSDGDLERKQQETEQLIKFSPDSADQIYAMEDGKGINSIVGLITEIISVVGVVLMFRLKKTGFSIYIAGELLPYIINIAVKGGSQMMGEISMMGGPFKALGIFIFSVMIIIDVVFIFLYSRQTKYMS